MKKASSPQELPRSDWLTTIAPPVSDNDWLKENVLERYLSENATKQNGFRNSVIEIKFFAELIYKITGYLSCPKFDPTEIVNQLIDNCVSPGLYFAVSIINYVNESKAKVEGNGSNRPKFCIYG